MKLKFTVLGQYNSLQFVPEITTFQKKESFTCNGMLELDLIGPVKRIFAYIAWKKNKKMARKPKASVTIHH